MAESQETADLRSVVNLAMQGGPVLYNARALLPWWTALNNHESQRADIVMFGDSVTEGVGVSAHSQRLPVALQTALRREFPIAGKQADGYVPASVWINYPHPSISWVTGAANPIDSWASEKYGLGSKAQQLTTGNKIRYDFNGTRIRVWYGWNNDGLTANGTLTLDGGSGITLAADATPGSGQYWDSGVLTDGAHYVEVTGTAEFLPIMVEGFESFGSAQDVTAGVHVYDSSHSSYFSTQFTGSSVANGSRMWQVIDVIKPTLYYVNLGINDPAWSVSAATTKSNLEAIIARAVTASAGSPYCVLIVIPYTPISSSGTFAANMQAIRDAIMSMITPGGSVAFLDMNASWPTLAANTTRGIMLETDYPLHPNPEGHALQLNVVLGALRVREISSLSQAVTGKKVSALTNVTTPADTDEFPIVNGGTTKAMSLDQLVTYLDTRNHLHNASVSNQTGFATDTYLTGSNVLIPSGRLQAKTMYRLKFNITKTAAGTATPIINVRIGTAGTTADTARITLTHAAQTGAIDEGVYELFLTFRTVGSGTSTVVTAVGMLDHRLATTGLANVNTSIQTAVSAGFDGTVTGLQVGCSVNGGASASWTVNMVQAELFNLA